MKEGEVFKIESSADFERLKELFPQVINMEFNTFNYNQELHTLESNNIPPGEGQLHTECNLL